jgi:transposase InsO family protein
MTSDQYIIERKLSIVELGKALRNVSEACRLNGVSRQHYYDIKRGYAERGAEGLIPKTQKAPRLALRTPPALEARILAYSLEFPTRGCTRVAAELKAEGHLISAGGVRGVWVRNGLGHRKDRLKRLEEWAAKEGIVLSAAQQAALEGLTARREAHGEIETHHPGFLVGQDTYYVGHIKGVGAIYQQTMVDTYSNYGFAKLYADKTALTAADALNSKVLPHFDAHSMRVLRMLTDNGPEYVGRLGQHRYELFLQLAGIEHSRIRPYRPQSNGTTEKLNQTIQGEFYAVEFRRKAFTTLDEIQAALDVFMEHYNRQRSNQGKHCKGRTPEQTFLDGIELYKKLVHSDETAH